MLSQKMTRKGFTLVELIVVITILAILGTIAFLSFNGYSAGARDSKRTSDLRNLVSAVTTKQTEGISYFNLVTSSGSAYQLANTEYIAGDVVGSANYTAGTVNFTALNLNGDNFKDPNGQNYLIGTSTKAGGVFQLAAALEGDSAPASKVALVEGNFMARGTTSYTGTGSATDKTITLPATAAGFFKKGDKTTLGNVTKISGDGLTLTVDGTVTTGSQAVALAATDAAGLIASTAGATTPVVNQSGSTLPY